MANIKTKIILRNDTLTRWNAVNPKLSAGEIGLAQLTNGKYEIRIGDGNKSWKDLIATNIEIPAANITGLSYVEYQLSALDTVEGEQAKFQLCGKNADNSWVALGNPLTIPEVDFSEVNAKIDGVAATVNTLSTETISNINASINSLTTVTDNILTTDIPAAKSELSAYTDKEVKGLSDEVYATIEGIKGAVATGVSFIGTVVELSTSDDGKGLYKLSNESEYIEAVNGGLALSGDAEFVWSDTTKSWVEFGDTGNLASKDFVSTKIDEVTNKHTEVASEDAKPTEGNVKGDTCVVKTQIGTTGKYSYTAYVWNGTTWAAMDGNYNASNVIFDENLTYTVQLGTLAKPSSGSATLETAGKSIEDLFKQILAEESKSLTIDKTWATSFSVANDQNQTGEVGSAISKTPKFELKSTDTPSWDSFGGINESGTKVTSTGSVLSGAILSGSTVLASKTGVTTNTTLTSYTLLTTTWTSSTFTDAGESRTVTATSYATGSTSKPITNLGNLVLSASTETNDKITGITKTAGYSTDDYTAAKGGFNATAITPSNSSQTVTAKGYRKGFFGYRKDGEAFLDLNNMTSDDIRSGIHATTFNFGTGNSGTSSAWPSKFTVPTGATQIIFAVPANAITADGGSHKYIKWNNLALGDWNFDNKGELRKITTKALMVNGAKADTAIEYAIWTIDSHVPFTAAADFNISYGKTSFQN